MNQWNIIINSQINNYNKLYATASKQIISLDIQSQNLTYVLKNLFKQNNLPKHIDEFYIMQSNTVHVCFRIWICNYFYFLIGELEKRVKYDDKKKYFSDLYCEYDPPSIFEDDIENMKRFTLKKCLELNVEFDEYIAICLSKMFASAIDIYFSFIDPTYKYIGNHSVELIQFIIDTMYKYKIFNC